MKGMILLIVLPLLAAFMLLALLMVFAQGSTIGPFIYALF